MCDPHIVEALTRDGVEVPPRPPLCHVAPVPLLPPNHWLGVRDGIRNWLITAA